jgi:hypothetical protein
MKIACLGAVIESPRTKCERMVHNVTGVIPRRGSQAAVKELGGEQLDSSCALRDARVNLQADLQACLDGWEGQRTKRPRVANAVDLLLGKEHVSSRFERRLGLRWLPRARARAPNAVWDGRRSNIRRPNIRRLSRYEQTRG